MDNPFVKYVAPSVGSVLGVIMLLSPIKAVWQIRKTQKLGVSQGGAQRHASLHALPHAWMEHVHRPRTPSRPAPMSRLYIEL